MRTYLMVVLLAPAAFADRVEQAVIRAVGLEDQVRPNEGADLAMHRSFQALQKVAQKNPTRWEPWFAMGLNRCQTALYVRAKATEVLNTMRARGVPARELNATRQDSERFLRLQLGTAHDCFRKMEYRMLQTKGMDRKVVAEHRRFASASLKFAKAEHEEAAGGQPGSIEDFLWLLKRRFKPDLCARMIAEAYNELGARAFNDERYLDAQAYWDKALKFAQHAPLLRRRIVTNKAGGFEMDNEFELAEKVLREQLEKDPHVPRHWKNLGLLLGYQARYREAIIAYAKCRELCRKSSGEFFLGILHGNAWLRAAMIHGKLLSEDGDVLKAWKLFLEYRKNFGDDYNFSLAFGEFAMHMGAYDVAYPFIKHARFLQPFCPTPYTMLLTVAARTSGEPDVVKKRVDEAQKEFRAASARFQARQETATLKRICGGIRDVEDGGPPPGAKVMRLSPDPLAGATLDKPPEWILAAGQENASRTVRTTRGSTP